MPSASTYSAFEGPWVRASEVLFRESERSTESEDRRERIEYGRFARIVRPYQDSHAGIEIDRNVRNRAEVADREAFDAHCSDLDGLVDGL